MAQGPAKLWSSTQESIVLIVCLYVYIIEVQVSSLTVTIKVWFSSVGILKMPWKHAHQIIPEEQRRI